MYNPTSRRTVLRAATFLPLLCGSVRAADAEAFAGRVLKLAAEHRRRLGRLKAHAERTGQALLAGGAWWVTGAGKGWISELTGRAGGPAAAAPLRSAEAARKGDVAWLSFSPETYSADLQTARELEERGCVVTAFGPEPPGGQAAFPHALAGLTQWSEDERLTLMGNLLSLWSLTAEVAACTARNGKTLAMLQSAVLPGASERNAKYRKNVFHQDEIRMQPAAAGVLARAYLDFVNSMLRAIQEREMAKLRGVAGEIRRGVRDSRPATLRSIGHLLPYVAERDARLFRISSGGGRDRGSLVESARDSGYLVWLGYAQVPPDLVSAVRATGAKTAWIVASDAGAGLADGGDVVIDQHWKVGDAAVQVPGYDVPVLPPSAVAQLFIYEILVRGAGG